MCLSPPLFVYTGFLWLTLIPAQADAATQVEQAQGAAVSVTQAALAVVGTFIGSSLLTIAVFYLFLRLRENRRRRSRAVISYPRKDSLESESSFRNFGTGAAAPVVINPPRVLAGASRASFGAVQDLDDDRGGAVAVSLPPGPRKPPTWALFPKTPSPVLPPPRPREPESPTSRFSVQPPSLQQWLREGTVSPFGTLRKDAKAPGPNWPFAKKTMATGTGTSSPLAQGVGGVNASRGGLAGRVMEPNKGLPLRESS